MSSKSAIRKLLKLELRKLSPESIARSSQLVIDNAIHIEATYHFPSIYLSMHGEVDTSKLVEHLVKTKGRIFIPKVIGPKPQDMVMISVNSIEEIESFPKSSWGIPEPPMPSNNYSIESYGMIDLVFVPGVAFDNQCRRLGHGKGYYGKCSYRWTNLGR